YGLMKSRRLAGGDVCASSGIPRFPASCGKWMRKKRRKNSICRVCAAEAHTGRRTTRPTTGLSCCFSTTLACPRLRSAHGRMPSTDGTAR
ncbi:unnamed protein product, partial [Effrenium voratum]